MPKCGGSGPCLSGGELSGVCCQRKVHVLRASMYTREQNTLIESFFSLSSVVGCWSVLQDYSTHLHSGPNILLSCCVNGKRKCKCLRI